ncbi:hypothetical protein HY732_00665 [Candidatus Uhrbacteria bacterium]|nr:hypothetical protein [Candidatus Uhrbacteria bacterium]
MLQTYLRLNNLISSAEDVFPEDMFPSQANDESYFEMLTVDEDKGYYWKKKIKDDLSFVRSVDMDSWGCYF